MNRQSSDGIYTKYTYTNENKESKTDGIMVVLIKGIWWAFHCSLSIKSFFNLFWVLAGRMSCIYIPTIGECGAKNVIELEEKERFSLITIPG